MLVVAYENKGPYLHECAILIRTIIKITTSKDVVCLCFMFIVGCFICGTSLKNFDGTIHSERGDLYPA